MGGEGGGDYHAPRPFASRQPLSFSLSLSLSFSLTWCVPPAASTTVSARLNSTTLSDARAAPGCSQADMSGSRLAACVQRKCGGCAGVSVGVWGANRRPTGGVF